jgi:hypothetical protein
VSYSVLLYSFKTKALVASIRKKNAITRKVLLYSYLISGVWMPRNGGPGQGISSGGDLPSSASRSPQLPPLYRPADAPRVQVVERTVDALSGRKTDKGGVRSAGGDEGGGRREERLQSLTSSVRRRGAVTRERKVRP